MAPKKLPVSSVSTSEPVDSSYYPIPLVIPAWAQRLLFLLDKPTTRAESIAKLIAQDKNLSRFICTMGGSANARDEISKPSLIQAITTLGFKQVQALILSTATAGLLTWPADGYRQSNGRLWEHSINTAANARWIAQAIHYPAAEEAYAAGLIHDIGKPLLDSLLQAKYHQVVECLWKRKLSLWQAEQSLLNTDHAEVGGILALRWRFPRGLAEAIRCHHLPGSARVQPELAAIVHVANILAPQFTQGLSSLGSRGVHPAALRILDLDIPLMESMRARIWEEQTKNQLFSITPPVLGKALP